MTCIGRGRQRRYALSATQQMFRVNSLDCRGFVVGQRGELPLTCSFRKPPLAPAQEAEHQIEPMAGHFQKHLNVCLREIVATEIFDLAWQCRSHRFRHRRAQKFSLRCGIEKPEQIAGFA